MPARRNRPGKYGTTPETRGTPSKKELDVRYEKLKGKAVDKDHLLWQGPESDYDQRVLEALVAERRAEVTRVVGGSVYKAIWPAAPLNPNRPDYDNFYRMFED